MCKTAEAVTVLLSWHNRELDDRGAFANYPIFAMNTMVADANVNNVNTMVGDANVQWMQNVEMGSLNGIPLVIIALRTFMEN